MISPLRIVIASRVPPAFFRALCFAFSVSDLRRREEAEEGKEDEDEEEEVEKVEKDDEDEEEV